MIFEQPTGFSCGVGLSIFPHGIQALGWLESADEHRDGFVELATDDIQAMMHAIGEVDIGGARLGIHGLIPLCAFATKGMGSLVDHAKVGFGLDDGSSQALAIIEHAHDGLAQEPLCYSCGILRQRAAFGSFAGKWCHILHHHACQGLETDQSWCGM